MNPITSDIKERAVALRDLKPGETATVLAIRVGSELLGQLMGMGLFAGTTVTVLQGGGRKPTLLSFGETRVALGHELTEVIFVEPVTGTNPSANQAATFAANGANQGAAR